MQVLIFLLLPLLSFAQIDSHIEGVIFQAPCRLEYMRTMQGHDNYACDVSNEEHITQYSLTVNNLSQKMYGMNSKAAQNFRSYYLEAAKDDALANGEEPKFITLRSGQRALLVKSYIEYSGHQFMNTSIVFLIEKKCFIFNLTTTDFSSSKNLAYRIRVQ